MKTVAIIQARMGSSRLPGKVLKDLGGLPVLEWVVRAAQQTPGVCNTVVATTNLPADDIIESWCTKKNIMLHSQMIGAFLNLNSPEVSREK